MALHVGSRAASRARTCRRFRSGWVGYESAVADTLIRPDTTQSHDSPRLNVQFTIEDLVCTLRLSGVLVADSIVDFESQIDRLGCTTFRTVALDLSQLSQLDAVGANVILGFHHYVGARQARMLVCGASESIASLLNQLELDTRPSMPLRSSR
jgi:anti-anti-sigma factor